MSGPGPAGPALDPARELPFRTGRLSPAFRRRLVAVPPDRPRRYDPDEWRGALVVVEQGRLDLCSGDRVRSFAAGSVLHLQDLGLRELRTPGPDTCVLIAVDRRRPVPYRIIHLPARPFLGTRRTCTPDTTAVVADRIPEIVGRILAAGVPITGAPFLRYHVLAADGLDVEAGVPVDVPHPLADPAGTEEALTAGELPAGRYAVSRHVGPFDGLAAATDALLAAGTADGLAWDRTTGPDGEHWTCRTEHFLTHPAEEPDPDRFVTELSFRLADTP